MTIVPYMQRAWIRMNNSASHPDLTLRQQFHQLWTTLKHFEKWSRQEI